MSLLFHFNFYPFQEKYIKRNFQWHTDTLHKTFLSFFHWKKNKIIIFKHNLCAFLNKVADTGQFSFHSLHINFHICLFLFDPFNITHVLRMNFLSGMSQQNSIYIYNIFWRIYGVCFYLLCRCFSNNSDVVVVVIFYIIIFFLFRISVAASSSSLP